MTPYKTHRPKDQLDHRVETGPLQFEDDWPGFFFRGDDAFALADFLDKAARLTTGDPAVTAGLEAAATALRTCEEEAMTTPADVLLGTGGKPLRWLLDNLMTDPTFEIDQRTKSIIVVRDGVRVVIEWEVFRWNLEDPIVLKGKEVRMPWHEGFDPHDWLKQKDVLTLPRSPEPKP